MAPQFCRQYIFITPVKTGRGDWREDIQIYIFFSKVIIYARTRGRQKVSINLSEFNVACKSQSPHQITQNNLDVYVDLKDASKLLPADLDRVTEINKLEDFSRFIKISFVNPVWCVGTVCHQVRCMYWGNLGHFRRAISHLMWYKIVCMRCLDCIFSQMESTNKFSMFLQSGVPKHFLWSFIVVWT